MPRSLSLKMINLWHQNHLILSEALTDSIDTNPQWPLWHVCLLLRNPFQLRTKNLRMYKCSSIHIPSLWREQIWFALSWLLRMIIMANAILGRDYYRYSFGSETTTVRSSTLECTNLNYGQSRWKLPNQLIDRIFTPRAYLGSSSTGRSTRLNMIEIFQG